MGLAQLILSSVRFAKKSAGNLLVTFRHEKKTGSNYSGGKTNNTYAQAVDVSGAYEDFEDGEVERLQLKVTDSKVIMFVESESAVPQAGDQVTDGSNVYQVLKSHAVKAGSQVVLAVVYMRI